jgi:ketosteroid isomerase-like protein
MPGDSDSQRLAEIHQCLEDGENRGDVQPMTDVLANDAVFIVPDFPVKEGKAACVEFLGDLVPGLLAVFERTIRYVSDEIRVMDGLAYDRGTFSFTVRRRTGGDTETVTGKYFWLYSRDGDGAWKLWRAVVTRDEAEDSA